MPNVQKPRVVDQLVRAAIGGERRNIYICIVLRLTWQWGLSSGPRRCAPHRILRPPYSRVLFLALVFRYANGASLRRADRGDGRRFPPNEVIVAGELIVAPNPFSRVLLAPFVVIMEEVLFLSHPEPNRSRLRMFRSLAFAGAAVAALAANVALSAGPRGEIIAETAAARHGLTRAWFTQVQMDVGRSRVQSVVLDDDTLFVQTDRAMIQAINAETGQTLWSKQVGKPNHPTMTPGVSRDLVVVLNGSRLFALNRANGDLLYETPGQRAARRGAGRQREAGLRPHAQRHGRGLPPGVDDRSAQGTGQDPRAGANRPPRAKRSRQAGGRQPAMSEEERAAAEKTRRENIRLRQEFIPPLSCQSAGHAVVQPLVLTPGRERRVRVPG